MVERRIWAGSHMLAWSEGIDNGDGQKTRNHGYDVIVGVRAIYWITPITPQTCHAKPKNLKSTGAIATSFFPARMPTASSLA